MDTKKGVSDIKAGKLSMDNIFVLLWAVVLGAVMLVMILGQFLVTVLLCVAIVAYINKAMGTGTSTKK